MSIQVLHAYRTYFPDPPGGVQQAIRQIALATQVEGVKNTIFTLSPRPSPELIELPEGVVHRSKSWASPASCDLGGMQAVRRFRQLANSADLLFLHFPWPFADVLRLAAAKDRPSILLYHSDIVRQRLMGAAYAPLMWRTLRAVDCIIATSPAYAQSSSVLSHPLIRKKVRVIPLGIDDKSVGDDVDQKIFSRLALEESAPFFLFIGVLRYYKGLHYLIKAAEKLPARIVIAGSGPELSKLQKQAENEGSKKIIFAGQVNDAEKRALYERCCAVVLPSHLRSEAFGMVLVEASMYSKPLISCEIGSGTSYVNSHGKTGFVVEPASPPALMNAMLTLLDNPEMTKVMGLAARDRYKQFFSGAALGTNYAQIFAELAR